MNTDITAVGVTKSAVYLRCYPRDTVDMFRQRDALRAYAAQLGLPDPTLYCDNGRRSRGPLPELARLFHRAALGEYQVLFVPGPFVFSLSDLEARSVRQQFSDHGCRVIELPCPRNCRRNGAPTDP
ncbi:recombinase family protein [Streptomyces sp. NBC_00879]|uniref:hypothetical protein n=1 Tax=Streptomyces sp. NBC_00879 TaxID=2975855 RepID=UPI00386AA449|nr:recombinase family protein [Streptomyces sp. NBC_00879]